MIQRIDTTMHRYLINGQTKFYKGVCPWWNIRISLVDDRYNYNFISIWTGAAIPSPDSLKFNPILRARKVNGKIILIDSNDTCNHDHRYYSYKWNVLSGVWAGLLWSASNILNFLLFMHSPFPSLKGGCICTHMHMHTAQMNMSRA